jgi:hypothetical protein
VNAGQRDKTYRFTKLNQFTSADSTLIVVMVRANWKHGIFDTSEEMTFQVVISATEPNLLVYSTGDTTPIDSLDWESEFGKDTFGSQLNRWIERELA